MSVKVGLISDPHACVAPLREALEIFRRKGVATILCAGDIAGYGVELVATVELLRASGCRAVRGNHDLWHLERLAPEEGGAAEAYLRTLPLRLELTLAGAALILVHASPPASLLDGIRLRDETGALIPEAVGAWRERLAGLGDAVLVVGHTHQVFAEPLGRVLAVNPGSTRFNHSCAILHLPERRVQFFGLGGETPLLAWNWGLERKGQDGAPG
ncbi:hypothetical protein JCM30471_03890 [Desulfuromonas carbonis]|uniref:metallophosphoesterase family protein n=1 Tax=Desulfuromonas sp. DDH964 TaxID=1823759 RepID=UPI00078BCF4A|nr:metallophosphoesterase family protein [Desulfuromonas sp. DDH964]AMV71557.1 hypothetical protein DBW_1183 [Desulfuromonas sp. DDH964]